MRMILGALLITLCSVSYAQEIDNVTITQFCERYHQRSYFILRLEQIIELIKKFDKKPFIFKFNRTQFSNSLILQCIDEIEQTSSLQPFYKLWKDTRRFKYLENESFALSVTKLLFTIQHAIYTNTRHAQSNPLFDIELHLSCSSYTEATTIRKYHSKRLTDIYAFLQKVKCSQRSLFEKDHEGCDCSFITHYEFSNPAILDCIKKMEEQKNIKPLLALYKEFTTYKLIQNEPFVREFTTLTFIVTRNIFIHNIQNPPTTLQSRTRNQVTHIYENLDKLPIEEILEAIDLINNELPEMLEQYEFNSDMTWKEWLKKYWWVPPVVGAILTLRIREILYPIKTGGDDDDTKAKRMAAGARQLAGALLAQRDSLDRGGSADARTPKKRDPIAVKARLRAQAASLNGRKRDAGAGAGARLEVPRAADSQTHTRLSDVRGANMNMSRSHDGLPCLKDCLEKDHTVECDAAIAAANDEREDEIGSVNSHSITDDEGNNTSASHAPGSAPLPRKSPGRKPAPLPAIFE